MPYYAAMFRLVLRRECYLGKAGCVADLEGLLSTTKAEVRAKYHNFDLQWLFFFVFALNDNRYT